MGLQIRLESEDAERGYEDFDLATAGGWKLVSDWVDGLPHGKFPELASLVDTGHCDSTMILQSQLIRAMDEHHPDDVDVATTIEALINTLGNAGMDEQAAVVGVGEDEDDRRRH